MLIGMIQVAQGEYIAIAAKDRQLPWFSPYVDILTHDGDLVKCRKYACGGEYFPSHKVRSWDMR